jgi:hypothetical protein
VKFFDWFKKNHIPEAPIRADPDPTELAQDLAEANKLHVVAERQAHTAAVAVNDLRRVNLRNGFAPAIERSVRRKLGEA